MRASALAIAIAAASCGPCCAGILEWTEVSVDGDRAIEFNGPNFGVTMRCNWAGNITVTLTTVASTLPATHGRDGFFLLVRDDTKVTQRAAWREPAVGDLAVFEAYLFPDQMASAILAKEWLYFGISLSLSDLDFLGEATAKNFAGMASSLLKSCPE